MNDHKNEPLRRPQEPQSPFPYLQQEVTYENKAAGITLAGTLTIPQGTGPFPAAIIISGMGPTERNGTFNGHKPYWVLADCLTRHGIAVVRFDKRGVGASTGTFGSAITCRDLADDVRAGIDYLKTCKDINPHDIVLIGHSEGGLIATMLASESNDIAGVVLMAGAVVNSTQGLIEQVAVQLRADGASDEMIKYDGIIRKQVLDTVRLLKDPAETEQQLLGIFADYWAALPEHLKTESNNLLFAFNQAKSAGTIAFMNSPYYRYIITYDSSKALEHVTAPLLALYGQYDFMAPHIVFPVLQKALAKANNKEVTLLELPKLNHSFQTCKTGAIAEYGTLEETMSPLALKTITDWILS